MPRILFAWELGQGLGHITIIKPLVERLQRAGHEVALAVQDLTVSQSIMRGVDVPMLHAPFYKGRPLRPFTAKPHSLPHILHNKVFCSQPAVDGLIAGWRSLYQTLHPDLCVFDFAPSAMLTARGRQMKTAMIGTGFSCPPPLKQYPNWRPEEGRSTAQLDADQQQVLEAINGAASRHALPGLSELSDLFAVDKVLLSTIPELDHFDQRTGDFDYYGCWASTEGDEPIWPEHGSGPRLFCYLKNVPCLREVLALLARNRNPTVCFASGLPRPKIEEYSTDTLRIHDRPLDLQQAARGCDAAILHGGHGASVFFLTQGKPLFLVPQQREQMLTGKAIESKQLGVMILQDQMGQLQNRMARFRQRFKDYRRNAQQLAQSYKEWQVPEKQADLVARALESLLSCAS